MTLFVKLSCHIIKRLHVSACETVQLQNNVYLQDANYRNLGAPFLHLFVPNDTHRG
jgi:hypothetical protein